ncbi:MAG: SsrA-binding protein SmpB [Bdellovibrionales bacterium]|nr:SsrA-binding protein SmpB [Bdellovibrionales bacterium]
MAETTGQKLISSNSSARGDYFLEEFVEAGIVLQGTEIKSIRNSAPNLKESFVEVTKNRSGRLEAWLVNLHIGPYSHGNIWNHEPRRRRKLLLHAHQIRRMFGYLTQDGKTIVATRMYFVKGRAKVEVAVAKGKKKGDKRADDKKRSQNREIDQAMKRRNR